MVYANLKVTLWDRLGFVFNKMEQPSKNADLHLFVVEPELVQNRRMQIAVIVRVLYSFISELVGGAVNGAALYTAAVQTMTCSPSGCGLDRSCSATTGCGRTRS